MLVRVARTVFLGQQQMVVTQRACVVVPLLATASSTAAAALRTARRHVKRVDRRRGTRGRLQASFKVSPDGPTGGGGRGHPVA
jgi:hypothetical protein